MKSNFSARWGLRMFVKEVTLDNCISGDLCLYHYAASFFPPNLKRIYECLQIKLPIWNRKMLVCLHRNTCIKNRLSVYGHILTSKSTSGDERCLLWMNSDCRCEFSRDAAVCLNSLFIDYPIITTIIIIIITNISSRANYHSSPLCSQRYICYFDPLQTWR